jgi:site-specific DNA-methyltransferase (adenine-specific)
VRAPYYSDSLVTIYHGDARVVEAEIPWVADAKYAIVTDPPYGIGDTASRRRSTTGMRRRRIAPREWDASAPDVHWLIQRAPIVAIWGGNHFRELPPSRGWFIWTKPDAPPSMGSAEMCWTNLNRTTQHISVSIAATNAERVGHPTQKPLDVMVGLFGFLKLPWDAVVVDPYMGSGSTLVAAKLLCRKAIGIEIEERYCEIAAQRLSQEVFDFGGAA